MAPIAVNSGWPKTPTFNDVRSLFFRWIMSSRVSLVFLLILGQFKSFLARLTNNGRSRNVPPFNPEVYEWQKPAEGDVRSPCPALNTLANHGYLPHDGKNISRHTMIGALQQGYHLSYALAWFITTGGYLLTGQFNHMSLFDLCRHNGIEHNASIAHCDTKPGDEYAPPEIDWKLFERMRKTTADGGKTLTAADVARVRVNRECESFTDKLHAEIARGEIGLILDIFGGGPQKREVDLDMLHAWWSQERFPDGWCPGRTQSFADTILCSQTVKMHMEAIRDNRPDEPQETFFIRALRVFIALFEKDWDIRVSAQQDAARAEVKPVGN